MQTTQEKIESVTHWYHQIDFPDGLQTPGIHLSKKTLDVYDRLGFPKDFTGMRVLDIGCADGYFSFVAESRGAREVIALDYRLPTASGFSVAAGILGSHVQHVVGNVYDLDPARLGRFDFIIFAGVLYHLRNPLLAMDRVRAMCNKGALAIVETHVIDPSFRQKLLAAGLPETTADSIVGLPMWDFYQRDSLNSDYSNKWAPTLAGLHHLCTEAQLDPVAIEGFGSRGAVLGKAVDDELLERHRRADTGSGHDYA